MNASKKVNVLDLVIAAAFIAVVVFGAIKLSDSNVSFKNSKSTKVVYSVECKNNSPEILEYIAESDRVFEKETLSNMGVVTGITSKPETLTVEDHKKNLLVTKEIPDKTNVTIEITADGVVNDGNISVDSENILIGKSVDLIVGDSALKGVIVALEYEDANTVKEEEQ